MLKDRSMTAFVSLYPTPVSQVRATVGANCIVVESFSKAFNYFATNQ